MNDEQLKELLRRVRPVGPPDSLRGRVLSVAPMRSVWQLGAAAAALLLTTLALDAGMARLTQQADVRPGAPMTVRMTEDLADMVAGNPEAERFIEFMRVEEQMQAPEVSPDLEAPETTAGDGR